MAADVDERTYDIGTTSVRMVRAGKVIQMRFSNPKAAALYFQEFDAIFKRLAMG